MIGSGRFLCMTGKRRVRGAGVEQVSVRLLPSNQGDNNQRYEAYHGHAVIGIKTARSG